MHKGSRGKLFLRFGITCIGAFAASLLVILLAGLVVEFVFGAEGCTDRIFSSGKI